MIITVLLYLLTFIAGFALGAITLYALIRYNRLFQIFSILERIFTQGKAEAEILQNKILENSAVPVNEAAEKPTEQPVDEVIEKPAELASEVTENPVNPAIVPETELETKIAEIPVGQDELIALGEETPSGNSYPSGAIDSSVAAVPIVASFIPGEFLKLLNKNSVTELKLGDHIEQEMTIFFSDIRQFTELAEDLTTEENFAFINSYLSRIVPEITKNGGFVDKYIGDAILALFPVDNGAEMAVKSATSIQEKLLEYNEHRAKCGYRPLSMGIGIHTGLLMVGVVGTAERMQNTVISDAVNLASRMEGLTKAFRISLAISEATFKKLEDPGSYQYRFVGKVRVKGKSEPVSIFEIFDGVDKNLQIKKVEANRFFEQGMFLYYQRKYAEALQEFRKVLEFLPEDGASAFYIDNCMAKLRNH